MILCDIGNSTFHFLVNEKEYKISVNEKLEQLDFLKNNMSDVYFISVNEKGTKEFKDKFPHGVNLAENLKFNTKYSNNLGVDRVVACKFINDGIVVDFGSAITVDVIENKQHLGGFIMTGFDKLKNSYEEISPKLSFDFNRNLNIEELPLNTNNAISFSIIKMVTAPIIELQEKYNKKLIITGESSRYFHQYFTNFIYEDRLIFNSMKQIIKEQK
jgi:type III pantothenate kinase